MAIQAFVTEGAGFTSYPLVDRHLTRPSVGDVRRWLRAGGVEP